VAAIVDIDHILPQSLPGGKHNQTHPGCSTHLLGEAPGSAFRLFLVGSPAPEAVSYV